ASIDSSLRIFCGSVNHGASTRFASPRAFDAERLTIPAISTRSFFPNAAYALACVAPIPPAPKPASLMDSRRHPRVRVHTENAGVRYLGQSVLFVDRELLDPLREFLRANGVEHVISEAAMGRILSN